MFPQNLVTTEETQIEVEGTVMGQGDEGEEVVNPLLHSLGISAINVDQAKNKLFSGNSSDPSRIPSPSTSSL